MTADRNLDRQLSGWLADQPAAVPADLLARSLRRVAATPQRPGWLARGGWQVPMRGLRPLVVPAWAIVLLLLGAVLVLAAVGARLVFDRTPSLLVDASPKTSWGIRVLSDDTSGIRQVVAHLMEICREVSNGDA